MCEITFDPGKFDTLCGPLVDSFAPTLQDANYTRPLVEAIVNQVRKKTTKCVLSLVLLSPKLMNNVSDGITKKCMCSKNSLLNITLQLLNMTQLQLFKTRLPSKVLVFISVCYFTNNDLKSKQMPSNILWMYKTFIIKGVKN